MTHSNTSKQPSQVCLALSEPAQLSTVTALLNSLAITPIQSQHLANSLNATDDQNQTTEPLNQELSLNKELPSSNDVLTIVGFVDGRGLACPQPLLKTKVGLRTVNKGEGLYLVATDPNSMQDIQAFSQQKGLNLWTWQVDGLCHFLIQNGNK